MLHLDFESKPSPLIVPINSVMAFSTKNEMTKILDIQNDTFDIEGFNQAFEKAQSQCKK